MRLINTAAVLFCASLLPLHAQSIAAKTTGMQHHDGYLPLDYDAKTGKIYLEITRLDTDIVYTHGLPYGTGSNDLGLDRGQVSEGQIVRFERFGPKILLVQPNSAFRTSAADPAEQLAVRQSFPESVLYGFKVEAEDAGNVLVDATDFFLRDAHGVAEILTQLKQGSYKLDPSRSAIAADASKAFPMNIEVESILTFATDGPASGEFVGNVAPDPHALTVHERQSFVELPGPGFTPRRFDPRAGYFPATYRDYNAPLGDPLDRQFILRHRLIQKDPACRQDCEAVTPIHYYVDRGAPEPIRTALVEGARWWDQAFMAAGWKQGTFLVDVLPADADPMDIRYNIIQWVHRYTRGWSYGAAIADPRTGEIIKGNVTLGSLRGRQDYLIAEALLSPYLDGKPLPAANDPMLQMVLARTRQLAAHETGHTLGLAHNFAASTIGSTKPSPVSVMDYPHPWITLDAGGKPDLSHAYADHIGTWDKVAINYGYRQFPNATEDPTALASILTLAQKAGLYFITDRDARPAGSAHPYAHLWDNGPDPAAELTRILAVRSAAMKRFGENAIRAGAPMAQLEDTLVPLYLLHRYQTEAAVKEIGGLDYRYALRSDGQRITQIVAPADQRKALDAILKTLSPETLTLPESLLRILPPRPPGDPRTRESFASQTGLTFDPVAASEAAADLTLQLLFNPQRASRLVQYHARDASNPGLDEVIASTLISTIKATSASGLALSIQHAVASRTLEALLALAADPTASSEARSIALAQITSLQASLGTPKDPSRAALLARIEQFKKDPSKLPASKPLEAPPGMPIGDPE